MTKKKSKEKNFVTLIRKPGLYIKDTRSEKGRGVFCKTAIKKGEILEITPSILLNESETVQVDKTRLVNYTFVMDGISSKLKKKNSIKKPDMASSVVMGVLTFCNHGNTNNATVLLDEKDGTLYYILKAVANIPPHTEICTTYGDGWFDER